METPPPRKRQKLSSPEYSKEDNESTEFKLALLSSLHPRLELEILLNALTSANGSVITASDELRSIKVVSENPRKKSATGHQSSLRAYQSPFEDTSQAISRKAKRLTKKGQTLHLYTSEDIAQHTPCSIIHNFLPLDQANSLLRELLDESPTFKKQIFKIFDNVVQSPHSACFYVESLEEQTRQKTEYLYNGRFLEDVRQITPHMRAVSSRVHVAVNEEIAKRIRTIYPGGKRLRYQSSEKWKPNAAFVNCYNGGRESVGYHSDELTYLGPRAIIGSLSLGVPREFRVRRIVTRVDDKENTTINNGDSLRADAEGQIAIHLPHNSLLIMHAEMQEEWKHSIHPASTIDPHPIAGNKRINITYRNYRSEFHPRFTPRCRCNIATVLRCVQRKKENNGRYMWMCHAGNAPGKEGCGFFQWAEFDDNGKPLWAHSGSVST